MIAPDQIKPKVRGKSDFFSWQLYRWAKKHHPRNMRIWSGTWNSCSGIDAADPVLYIGSERDGDWIHARWLRNLCTLGANIGSLAAYGPGHDTKNWKDITDQFWADYLKRGVCAIHGDFCHNWNYAEADLRVCQYCGKTEQREIIMVPKETWNPVIEAASASGF